MILGLGERGHLNTLWVGRWGTRGWAWERCGKSSTSSSKEALSPQWNQSVLNHKSKRLLPAKGFIWLGREASCLLAETMKPLQDCQANVQSEFLSLTITVKGKGGEAIKIKPCLTRKEALAKSRVISFGSLDELLFHGYRAIIPGNTPHNTSAFTPNTHTHTTVFKFSS